MSSAKAEIEEIIDRETRAWDTKDVDLLLSIFHPDMVWVWPVDPHSHDPMAWVSELGRFNRDRWKSVYSEMFDSYDLIHNRRETKKIVLTSEEDGAFAVVDIDTLWRNRRTGKELHWLGRACKTYAKLEEGWRMIAQTGVLDYSVT